MSESSRELARRWFDEVWTQRRSDTIDELIHPDCVGHHEGETTRGGAAFKALRDQILGLVPDIRLEVEEIVADENNAVVRWRFTGRCSTGSCKPVAFEGMTWLKFSKGKIIEGWDRWNQAAFVQQLSL
ncbi:MAG: hypothetical protein QOE70_1582 [Chthoniobacter sp.]|jgi:predicted ester cyclase|nr:hypothetical protein [Chthoniobacter sp.]